MRRLCTLLLWTACAAPSGLDVNAAPAFKEPLHRFFWGVPRDIGAGARILRGDLDLERQCLKLEAGGEYTSAALDPSGAFDELLMSWNVEVPKGAGVILQVAVQGAGPWSPWLHLADWGQVERTDLRRQFEHGEVHVDILKLEQPMARARYRILAVGAQPEEPVRVWRTTLVFSSRSEIRQRFASRKLAATQGLYLTVPSLSQQDAAPELAPRICSPTSVAMALAHAGQATTPTEVARVVYDREHDIYGNWVRAVQGAFEFGVPGRLVRLSSWSAVEHFIQQGLPLIVSIKVRPGELTGAPYVSTAGHLLVITGLDGRGGVEVNDPAAATESGVARTYAQHELEQVWMARGGVTYIIGR